MHENENKQLLNFVGNNIRRFMRDLTDRPNAIRINVTITIVGAPNDEFFVFRNFLGSINTGAYYASS